MNIILTGVKIQQDTKTLSFRKNNLVDVINITVDTDESWEYKLDVEYPVNKTTGQKLYNVIDLVRNGNVCSVVLTADMLPFNGKYIMQLRGISGDKVYHTDIFEVWVKYSIDVGDVYNPVPSEFYQIEDNITEMNNHPPMPSDDGYWMIWDVKQYKYVKSDIVMDVKNAVLYTTQDLTDEQKQQARDNIGAGVGNVTKEELDSELKNYLLIDDVVQSDYQQNDPTAPDYIKNRPGGYTIQGGTHTVTLIASEYPTPVVTGPWGVVESNVYVTNMLLSENLTGFLDAAKNNAVTFDGFEEHTLEENPTWTIEEDFCYYGVVNIYSGGKLIPGCLAILKPNTVFDGSAYPTPGIYMPSMSAHKNPVAFSPYVANLKIIWSYAESEDVKISEKYIDDAIERKSNRIDSFDYSDSILAKRYPSALLVKNKIPEVIRLTSSSLNDLWTALETSFNNGNLVEQTYQFSDFNRIFFPPCGYSNIVDLGHNYNGFGIEAKTNLTFYYSIYHKTDDTYSIKYDIPPYVNPSTKTDNQTQEVGVDAATGKLYTKPADASLGLTGAQIGQIAKITAVDDIGKPTAWKSVDLPNGGSGAKVWTKIIDADVTETTGSFRAEGLANVTEFDILWSNLQNASTLDSGLNASINNIVVTGNNSAVIVGKSGSSKYGWTRLTYDGLFWHVQKSAGAVAANNIAAGSTIYATHNLVRDVGAATTFVLDAPTMNYAPVSGKLEVWAR